MHTFHDCAVLDPDSSLSVWNISDCPSKLRSHHWFAFLWPLLQSGRNTAIHLRYDISLSDVEADSGGMTEAGTTQRDVVREGIVEIKVSFNVSKIWLQKLSAYKKLASITVKYLDMATMNMNTTAMYIDGYQVKLVSDTSYGSLWEVSFTLKEF